MGIRAQSPGKRRRFLVRDKGFLAEEAGPVAEDSAEVDLAAGGGADVEEDNVEAARAVGLRESRG